MRRVWERRWYNFIYQFKYLGHVHVSRSFVASLSLLLYWVFICLEFIKVHSLVQWPFWDTTEEAHLFKLTQANGRTSSNRIYSATGCWNVGQFFQKLIDTLHIAHFKNSNLQANMAGHSYTIQCKTFNKKNTDCRFVPKTVHFLKRKITNLFERQSVTERERQTDLPLAGSFLKCPNSQVWARPEPEPGFPRGSQAAVANHLNCPLAPYYVH